MKTNNTLIDDMISLSGNVLGNILGARHEMKAQGKQRLNQIVKQLDLVTREEFDAAFAMLSKARMMQEELSERLALLKSKLEIIPKASHANKSDGKQRFSRAKKNVKRKRNKA